MKVRTDQIRILLSEVPGEISLCIPAVGCTRRCPGCHSPEYWDTATEYTELDPPDVVSYFYTALGKASCICFMGGEWDQYFPLYTKMAHDMGFKTALYTGSDDIPPAYIMEHLDYLKVGAYKEEFGGLQSRSTNQRMFTVQRGKIDKDITSQFWH